MPSPSIVVVVVTFNGEKWIYDCICSMTSNGYDHCRIVVVDKASRDTTVSIIRNHFQEVILMCQKRNLGFGRGANIGIEYALTTKADYILLLNQDIKLHEDCIKNMIAVCEQNKDIGIASPLQMNYDGSLIDPHFSRLYDFKFDALGENKETVKDSMEVNTVIGASMLFRRNVVEKIGGFHPVFFLYHEEADLCRRAQYHGFQIHVNPNSIVYHKHIQLSPHEMTFKAKFSSTYGYYFYLLKNPYSSLFQNILMMFINMKEWVSRDRNLFKLIKRFIINSMAMAVVLIYLSRIIKGRKSDIMMKKPSPSS